MKDIRARDVALWALVVGFILGQVWVSPAFAQFESPLGGVASVTTSSGLSGSGLAGDPLAFTGTTTAAISTSAAAPQFSCTKTDATCRLSSATADSTTSATVGSFTLKAGADITASDLLLDVQDSAGAHALTVTEAGAATALASMTAPQVIGTATATPAVQAPSAGWIDLNSGGGDTFIYRLSTNNLGVGFG